MKQFLSLAALGCALSTSVANAAQLSVTQYPQNVYAIFLDGESTVFNGVGFSATPNGDAMFRNIPGDTLQIRPPGFPLTLRNRLLDLDPLDIPGAKGWSLLGVVTRTSEIAFNGGPLGQTIDTSTEPNADLFLANLMLPTNATATVQVRLVNGVETVFEQSIIVGVPEPAAFAMTGAGVLGLIAVRRRFRQFPRRS